MRSFVLEVTDNTLGASTSLFFKNISYSESFNESKEFKVDINFNTKEALESVDSNTDVLFLWHSREQNSPIAIPPLSKYTIRT